MVFNLLNIPNSLGILPIKLLLGNNNSTTCPFSTLTPNQLQTEVFGSQGAFPDNVFTQPDPFVLLYNSNKASFSLWGTLQAVWACSALIPQKMMTNTKMLYFNIFIIP